MTSWLVDLDICHFQVIFAGLTKSVAIISVITEMRSVMSQKVKFVKLWDWLA